MNMKTKRITESAMLLAVAIVLELVSKMFIPEMPFGGQITLVSMLPVVLISYRHGVKWGLVAGFTYAFLEMALGAKTVAAAFQPGYFGDSVMLINALVMCALDYLVAFTVLGIGGCFRHKIQKPGNSLCRLGRVVLHPGWFPCLGRSSGGKPQPGSVGPYLQRCVQRFLHDPRDHFDHGGIHAPGTDPRYREEDKLKNRVCCVDSQQTLKIYGRFVNRPYLLLGVENGNAGGGLG